MTKLKKLALAAAIASAATMPMASHAGVVIDGVAFNAGSQFITTSLWESVLTNVLDSLSGVGIVNQINCAGCGGLTWSDGNNNTQLTYFFSGYRVSEWYEANGTAHTGLDNAGFTTLAAKIDFTLGNVKLFTDRVSSGTVLNPSANPNAVNPALIAIDIAKATDGNLWLNYDGVTTTDLSGRVGSLFAATNTLNTVHTGGAGFGYLNVVAGLAGGLAAPNFRTSSFNVGGVVADARLDSSFSNTNAGAWPLSGSATFKTQAIPEPGSLALIALGLVGLATTHRRKSAKKV